MVPLEAWFLGGAVVAFGAAIWLVAQRERRGANDLAALADEEGWDLRRASPPGLVTFMAELARVGVVEETGLYLSGPTAAGPFQLVRTGGPGTGRRGRPAAWTFVHVRTAASSRGLWIRPNDRFRPDAVPPARATPGFARRFRVDADDMAEADGLVGERLCALLMRPQAPVHVGWQGHELVVAFPVGVASPRGVRTLLHYGATVAAALTRTGRNERRTWTTEHGQPAGAAAEPIAP